MKIMKGKHQAYTYLFGPVPSRRLGFSLGVDLMPHKTCSLDCIYCECGRTTHLTVQRDEYTPIDRIKRELADYLCTNPVLDHITFSGSGEPLLHRRIQEIVTFIKKEFPQYKLALLTNGTLLHDPEVREEIVDIDIVKVSVDTVSENTFAKLCRPHPDINIARVIDGLFLFSEMFSHQLWAEVFLVPGLNDSEAEIRSIKEVLEMFHPDCVHLNAMDRPGTEKWVQAVDEERIKAISDILGDVCLIGETKTPHGDKKDIGDLHQHVLSTIKRRPCTAGDVSKILGTCFSETKRHLEALSEKGEIEKQEMSRGIFYMIKS